MSNEYFQLSGKRKRILYELDSDSDMEMNDVSDLQLDNEEIKSAPKHEPKTKSENVTQSRYKTRKLTLHW